MANDLLVGKQVLVIEDELVIALELASSLRSMGAVPVGPARTVADGRLALPFGFDAAILDVCLADGEECYAVADELRRRGVPFVFMSGKTTPDQVPSRFGDAQFLTKPCLESALESALSRLFQHAA